MPETKVRTPSGEVVTVRHPDNATDQQIIDFARQQGGAAPATRGASDVPYGSGAEYALQTLMNVPGSAARYAGGFAEALMNPLDTIDSVVSLGAGALGLAAGEEISDALGVDPQSKAIARQVGRALTERYGSVDAAAETLRTDPVGVLGDLSMVLGVGGVGVAKTAGQVSKAAQQAGTKAQSAAAKIEPLGIAGQAVATAARAPAEAAAGFVGRTTGAGETPIKEAAAAGYKGGADADAFLNNMRGVVQQEEVLQVAKDALGNIKRQRSEDYRNAKAMVGENVEIIKFAPIVQAVTNAKKFGRGSTGEVINPAAERAIMQVQDIVFDWRKKNPETHHTPMGMDDLKQKIGAVLENIDGAKDKRAYAAVKQVYDSVGKAIRKDAKGYDAMMRQYQEMSDLIFQLESALSLGTKASADTAMRKLQSLMRDNVSTNYGQRLKLGKTLENYAEQPILASLAGQSLNPTMGRGISGQLSPYATVGAGGAGLALDPLTALASAGGAFALQSPRVMGEAAFAAGRLAGAPGRAIGAARSAAQQAGVPAGMLDNLGLPITNPLGRTLTAQAGLLSRDNF